MDHLNGTPLVVEWIDGSKMEGVIDTIYETDNHLEMDEDGYREYIACLLRVKAILSQPAHSKIQLHSFVELSSIDPPSKIYLKEVPPIWDDRCMG
ncbi:hypothetical protein SAMN04488112_12915 [Melghirimyces thermohalophilus]|mgnify:CR=1 FL=1|uniref:Uncharacterized protein n=1 Tax=Melghirimyces thermohalophilus TaxID=1236220 RepID=A0A1G6RNI4_9BACL|nr:hypothetical protein [Melghirimyces thermohalophilus]SDD05555.1 hypothetical protein SAMN04488112_12915 [Melghirimyces thermohalophilus]